MAAATNLVINVPVNITMKTPKVKVKFPKVGAQYAKQGMNRQQQAMANPVTQDQATAEARQAIEASGMPPEMFAEMGQLAQAAIQDKKKYPEFVKYMIDKRLETAESMKKPDFQMMATLAVLGKVAEDMMSQAQQGT
jgi:hypothetical protein